MSKLFTFLEHFDIHNRIRIYNDDELLFEGEMGDVPQRITNMMSVIRDSAKWKGDFLEVKVHKS